MLKFTTEAMLEHKNKLLQIPGSKLLFGGEALENHSIPPIYGAIKPTAIFVPLEEILEDNNNYDLVTREIFGPFQVNKGLTLENLASQVWFVWYIQTITCKRVYLAI